MQQINQGLRGIVKEGCGVSDVERLEDIEKIINAQKLNNDPMSIEWPFMSIRENDLRWLVSTVKELSTRLEGAHKYNDAMKLTVEEQQKEIDGLHWRNEWIKSQEEIGHLGASVHDLKQENARLRKVLEFYAMRHNYAYSALEDNIPKVNLDGGQKARQGLKE